MSKTFLSLWRQPISSVAFPLWQQEDPLSLSSCILHSFLLAWWLSGNHMPLVNAYYDDRTSPRSFSGQLRVTVHIFVLSQEITWDGILHSETALSNKASGSPNMRQSPNPGFKTGSNPGQFLCGILSMVWLPGIHPHHDRLTVNPGIPFVCSRHLQYNIQEWSRLMFNPILHHLKENEKWFFFYFSFFFLWYPMLFAVSSSWLFHIGPGTCPTIRHMTRSSRCHQNGSWQKVLSWRYLPY